MTEKEAKFLEGAFKRYYFEHFEMLGIPDRITEREFGFQRFDSGMIRHISLKTDRELKLLLMKEVPSDVYCSCACYTFPSMPMKEKDWKEADLIFDIDAKDLNLGCRADHTISVCGKCGRTSAQTGSCSACGSTGLETKSLPCRKCIAASKEQVRRLSDMLVRDFAAEPDAIQVYFSGNEGFHVHVSNSQFQQCGSKERAELVDYIMLNGAIPETFGMRKQKPRRDSFPDFGQWGWQDRFARAVYGSKSNRPKEITRLVQAGYASFPQTIAAVSERMGARIDPNVTVDIHRIFRLPGSLNSKSGLAKMHCTNLDSFDPYVDASFLVTDKVEVRADCPVRFALRKRGFGPYKDETVEVPMYAAAYMICKKLARIP